MLAESDDKDDCTMFIICSSYFLFFIKETLEPTYLPSGDKENNYTSEFFVHITDRYLTYAEVNFFTQVNLMQFPIR